MDNLEADDFFRLLFGARSVVMQRILQWLLKKNGVGIAEGEHLSMSAVREVVYRQLTVIIFLGMLTGGLYNYLTDLYISLVMDIILGSVLLINTLVFVTTQRKLLPPLPMILVAYCLLVGEVLFGNEEFIYFCVIFPVTGYLAVDSPHLGWLNVFWWAASTILAFSSLANFDATVFSACMFCVCIFLEMVFFILQHHEGELKNLAARDFLTNTLNRRAMEEVMAKAQSFKTRYGQSASIIMMDIDRFKEINDNYGHGEGDKVLVNLASFLTSRLRDTDWVCRYGGEEFVLILPNTRQSQAYKLAQRLREEVFHFRVSEKEFVSVSCGVAELRPGEVTRGWLDRCDRALYQAKENGRNRVEEAALGVVA